MACCMNIVVDVISIFISLSAPEFIYALEAAHSSLYLHVKCETKMRLKFTDAFMQIGVVCP